MVTWIAYQHEKLNHPSRADYYIMSLQASVQRLFAENPRLVDANDNVLTFGNKAVEETQEEMSKRVEYSKAAWLGAMGGKDRVIIKDAQGNIVQQPKESQPRRQINQPVRQPKPAKPPLSSRGKGRRKREP